MKKLMNKLSLKWRMTLLTGMVLTLCSFAMSSFILYNAKRAYQPIIAATISSYAIVTTPTLELQNPIGMTPLEISTIEQNLGVETYLFFIVFTLLGMIAVYYVSGRALKPVKHLSDVILEINENNLNTLLPQAQSKDEIGELTVGFNQVLVRLNEAFERQKQFTSNAAHELKTPLSAIKTGIQVLKMDDEISVSDYQENIEFTLGAVERLSDIVDKLMLLATQSEQTFEKEEIMLLPFIMQLNKDVSLKYRDMGIVISIQGDDCKVYSNQTLLSQVFVNLIENAYKYNKNGGSLDINIKKERDAFQVAFVNSGAGISSEDLEHIFEPFYRADKSRSRKIGGAGLGLSITKAIVESLDGNLTITSSVNKETTVVLTIKDKQNI